MVREALFMHRVAILATMHHKERVIAPILDNELGLKVMVPPGFNTDIFGTFTREVKRPGNQIETVRLKAEKALEVTDGSIAIASEGSFAPHPSLPYIASNREIVIFIDKEQDIEIIGEAFSTETNHSHLVVENVNQALNFAENIGFPEHGLVVMPEESPKDSNHVIKGIITEEKLVEAVNFILEKSPTGKAHLETDMRAMYNPTRMENIATATHNLVKKINTLCPKCSTPGFDIIRIIPGLPCELCHIPTTLTKAVVYKCQKCDFTQEKLFPNGRNFANPAQCMYCNP
ncbi:MAG: hypothetical protein QNJ51_19230 [Calothrix sp. MO_167.B12]|nr:hypothetical protein [Calothrix sp. MO_167.B12]